MGLLGCGTLQDSDDYMIEDLSRGIEPIAIPVVSADVSFPSFRYINSSAVFDRAIVVNALSTLDVGSYCDCPAGDCLTTVACTCSGAGGERFAYTVGGVLRHVFLQRLIREASDSTKVNNSCTCMHVAEGIEGVLSCSQHRPPTFISECNVKCGCHRSCGNRVVQRGMTYRVEIFHTGGAGWGVRTKDYIPRGGFVFEMTGEILTNAEQIVRNKECKDGPTYAVQIDADWAAERVLDDDRALCIDASRYGNVARFVNHRYAVKL